MNDKCRILELPLSCQGHTTELLPSLNLGLLVPDDRSGIGVLLLSNESDRRSSDMYFDGQSGQSWPFCSCVYGFVQVAPGQDV